ncbi:uncharacterized protein [Coffea arabica]|uniref:Uncharacterized protein n=1 Tax=Coffea arabica TaxID=13443 RepID=A0A6P6W8Z4_COFAR|nr:uncharacterized protein LOC113731059 [Coffea arabica]
MKLFDAHCHLQDPRIHKISPQIIKTALDAGVVHIAVNGVSEKDWQSVKEMSGGNLCIIPNVGLHPWFIPDRTPNWLNNLKEFLEWTPEAAVGEIGLDKAPWASHVDYADQLEVFSQQLQLAKELNRPASIHCVGAFDDMIEILKSLGPFPAGFLLHSYMGSAGLVPELANLGAYFSISGHLMPVEESKAKKILQAIPLERILLETDAPDALPKSLNSGCLPIVAKEASILQDEGGDRSELAIDTLNHPANIHHVLNYVAFLLEMDKEELAQISYENARNIFSYEGSKISA